MAWVEIITVNHDIICRRGLTANTTTHSIGATTHRPFSEHSTWTPAASAFV
jgi:hypothetical protein